MRNFFRLATKIDTIPLLQAVMARPQLWNQFTVRTHHPRSAHRVIDDIVLRYNVFNSNAGDDFVERVCSEINVVNYPAWEILPQAHSVIFALMHTVQGVHLGRVFISRQAPGVNIPPHSDRIAEAEEVFPFKVPPAVYYDRYHVVLKSEPGVVFRCGGESVWMAPGEIWWFNNQVEHEVINNSGDDKIHLIVDVALPRGGYVPNGT